MGGQARCKGIKATVFHVNPPAKTRISRNQRNIRSLCDPWLGSERMSMPLPTDPRLNESHLSMMVGNLLMSTPYAVFSSSSISQPSSRKPFVLTALSHACSQGPQPNMQRQSSGAQVTSPSSSCHQNESQRE